MIFQKGNLLIADPGMIGDIIFSRSIVLLTDLNREGAVGFVLNKPSSFFLDSFFKDIKNPHRVYIGGPVEQDNLYYIHKRPDLISNSIEISNGIYWGGDFEEIIQLIKENKITTKEVKFFLGYSGWAERQLEEEIEMKAWIVSKEMNVKKIFSNTRITLWRDYLGKLGEEYAIWKNTPENPELN